MSTSTISTYPTGQARCWDAGERTSAPEYSDEAIAHAFATRHARDMRYVTGFGRWYLWSGSRWVPDDTQLAIDRAGEVCCSVADDLRRQRLNDTGAERLARSLASGKTVATVERLARAHRLLAATTDQWDLDPDILNTPGGVVDLRTGTIRKNRPNDYGTKSTAVAPADAGTPCPIWTAFLHRVTAGDDELVAFLQRVAGYSLTGSTKEHALFFAHGTGRNGKGVFIGTLSRIMGDYAAVASMDTFTSSSTPQHPTDLAMLRGARLVSAQETEKGRRWAESKVKAMTGGDPITARFMRGDFFTFDPNFKLLIAGNHKPSLRSVDEAIRARFKLLPFVVTIPPEERDPDLSDKLRGEWPAILRWAIDGCLAWRSVGLRAPDVVTRATDDYLGDEDAFSLWLTECCRTDDKNPREDTSDLYRSWSEWAIRAGEFVGSMKSFSQSLVDRAFVKHDLNSARGFRGIALIRPDYTDDYRWK